MLFQIIMSKTAASNNALNELSNKTLSHFYNLALSLMLQAASIVLVMSIFIPSGEANSDSYTWEGITMSDEEIQSCELAGGRILIHDDCTFAYDYCINNDSGQIEVQELDLEPDCDDTMRVHSSGSSR